MRCFLGVLFVVLAVVAVAAPVHAEILGPYCLYIFGLSIDERMPVWLDPLMPYGPSFGNAMATSGPVSVVSATRSAGDGSVHIAWSLAARWTITGDYPWFLPVPYENGWCVGGICGEGQKITLYVEHNPCL